MPLAQFLHAGLARTLVLYLLAIAVWGLIAWRRGAGVSGGYWGALVIAEGIGIVQGAFGALLALERPPRELLHVLYGVSIVLALPLAHTYARGQPAARQSLAYGLAALFTAGLGIRGIQTA